MSAQALPDDPRTVITPDAFEVDPDLLGLPLAAPMRRGVATLVDLVLIGLITLVTRDVGAIVGVLVAVVFVRMALRSPITKDLPAPLAWAFRFSVGCLGLVILLISFAAIVWIRADPDLDDLVISADGVLQDGEGAVSVRDFVGGLEGGVALLQAADGDEAEVAARRIASAALTAGVDPDDLEDVLEEMTPVGASWEDRADDIYERAIAAAARGTDRTDLGTDPPAPLDTLSAEGALLALARTLETEEGLAGVSAESLRARALPAVAGDTLDALEDELRRADRRRERQADEINELEARVEELEQGSGIFRFAWDAVDRLGLVFGWGSIYFAVLLPWWKGQTPGKKLAGVRVLRLDGEPMTWWLAFERAGGYAAGFATGLLGFAQVYWDPNRQGIHDKIAGTVVVRERAPRAVGPPEPVGERTAAERQRGPAEWKGQAHEP